MGQLGRVDERVVKGILMKMPISPAIQLTWEFG